MKTNGSHTSIVSVSIPTHSGNSTGRMIGRPQQLTGWFFQTPPRAACGWTGRRTITNSATRWAEGVSRRGSSPPRRQVWKKRSPVLPLRSRRNPAPAGNPFQLARHPKCVRRPRAVRQHTLHARTNEGLVVNSQNRPLYGCSIRSSTDTSCATSIYLAPPMRLASGQATKAATTSPSPINSRLRRSSPREVAVGRARLFGCIECFLAIVSILVKHCAAGAGSRPTPARPKRR